MRRYWKISIPVIVVLVLGTGFIIYAQQGPGEQIVVSPEGSLIVQRVKNVDIALSNLTAKMNPIQMTKSYEKRGLVDMQFLKLEKKNDQWAQIVKQDNVISSGIKDFKLLNQGFVANNPRMFYLKTKEEDTYTLKDGKKDVSVQVDLWKVLKQPSGKWAIDDLKVLSEHKPGLLSKYL